MKMLLVILLCSNVFFSCAFFIAIRRLRIMSIGFMNTFVAHTKLKEHVEKYGSDLNSQENMEEAHNENFIKFLSDSRDWAFKYIEEVQLALTNFINKVEPSIVYFDTYGDEMGMKPNYESMVLISEAYKELKTLIPEEQE